MSGTPTAAGYYNFSFTLKDSTNTTINVCAAISVTQINITSARVLPNATQGSSYSFTFAATGGGGTYTWSQSGLPISSSNFAFSSAGVLTATTSLSSGPGRYNFNVTATDQNNVSYTKTFAIDVIGVPPTLPYVYPYGNFDDCSYGISCSRGIGVGNGGRAPFTWNVTGLPTGMSYRTGSGMTTSYVQTDLELWGTPTQLGTFNLVVTVTDADNKTATQTIPFRVSPLWMDGNDYLPNGTRGTAYSKLLRVIGGDTECVGAHVPHAALTGRGRSRRAWA